MTPLLSIIIPSRNETYLTPTIRDLLDKAAGVIEVLVVLEGYWCDLVHDPRVHYIHRGRALGLRAAINAAAALARGGYLMKIDAHCMVDNGYDLKLLADCPDDAVVVPRRKRLDAENWRLLESSAPDVDYEFLSFPGKDGPDQPDGLRGKKWIDRAERRSGTEFLVDENMCFQGSCWLMRREYFDHLDLMDEANYGTFTNEAVEIALKAWLSGGRVLVNKKTWYAHYHKPMAGGRGYRLGRNDMDRSYRFVRRWLDNSTGWRKQRLPFAWLIDHFSPVPTWPSNWKERLPACTISPS